MMKRNNDGTVKSNNKIDNKGNGNKKLKYVANREKVKDVVMEDVKKEE